MVARKIVPLKVAVIGAGVGGLAAALALARSGAGTTVFDRRQSAPVEGGGLWFFANGLMALKTLGLLDEILRHATVVRRCLVLTWNGNLLWRLPLEELAAVAGAPLILIGRSQLTELMRAALTKTEHTCPQAIQWGMRCTGFEDHGTSVSPLVSPSPRFCRPTAFDLLIGADGFHSVIRRQLLGLEYLLQHSRIWSGQARMPAADWPYSPGDSTTFLGQGRMLTAGVLAPRRGDREGDLRIAWFALDATPRSARSGGFHPRVESLMSHSSPAGPFSVRDRHPSRRWGSGRVTLLGDAAHPTLPDLAQGAAQALEGAVILAKCLTTKTDVAAALRTYERRRMRRTASVTRRTRFVSALSTIRMPDSLRQLGRNCVVPWLVDCYRTVSDPREIPE